MRSFRFPKRWRNFESEGADIARRFSGGSRCSVHGYDSFRSSGGRVIGIPWKGRRPGIGTRPFIQRHGLGSSSSRPDSRSIPPLPVQFLQAHDDRRYDPSTRQRNDVPFDAVDGKPPASCPPANHLAADSKLVSWGRMPDVDKWRLTVNGNEDPDSRHSCFYSDNWINSQVERWRADPNDFDCPWSSDDASSSERIDETNRFLWSNWTEGMVRDPDVSPILFRYDNLIGNSGDPSISKDTSEEERLLKVLYQYGLALITETPTYTDSISTNIMSEVTKKSHAKKTSKDTIETAESAILHLASIIGYHPLQTLYGSGVWSTSSQSSFYNTDDDGVNKDSAEGAGRGGGASTADSAYGSTSLPLHTDMTYASNPPGAQIFLMVQPATAASLGGRGPSPNDDETAIGTPKGQSVYLDGFAAARQLLLENPDAFRLLATTPRRYRCIDDEQGWRLEATGPLIEAVPGGKGEWGPVKSIRHNDLDRLPDLPPYRTADKPGGRVHDDSFYQNLKEAHEAWDDVLGRDSMRLVIDLRPGDCVLVANQRCLHGRYTYETLTHPRVVMGCYVGSDELSSKWRMHGLRVL